MARRRTLAAPPPDPFGEHRPRSTQRLRLLGGDFEFEADHPRLQQIVREAYAGLPPHRLNGRAPRFRVRLTAAPGRSARRGEPGLIRPLAGDGLLCGVMDGASFAALTPADRAGLIVVARDLLAHGYHVRYELLEFAVYVLAARARQLVPLHAACLTHAGAGVLVLGASGSGKSTLVLQAVLSGLKLVGEDSVLVQPQGLRATGIASYIHVRPDALRFLARDQRRALLRHSARIRRRSGVAKLEIDVRGEQARLAPAPAPIRAVVFLSRRRGQRELLHALPAAQMLRRLAGSQRYAARQPGWNDFCARIARLRGYELRRGAHPQEAVERLRILLAGEGHGTRDR
jgi:hypothetical protein